MYWDGGIHRPPECSHSRTTNPVNNYTSQNISDNITNRRISYNVTHVALAVLVLVLQLYLLPTDGKSWLFLPTEIVKI
jgi:hypothetical protein